MVNQVWGKHATVVTGSQDGSKQVSKNEWNENLNRKGLLGFDSETIASASSVTIPDDTSNDVSSFIKLSGSTSVDTLVTTNTSDGDLLFVLTTGSVTLNNTSSPSSAGDIRLLANSNKDLSTTVPTLLIRVGNFWYEFGGGATVDAGDLTGTTLASGVVTSSLTAVGTIVTGTWTGTAVADSYVASASTWNGKQNALTFGIADGNAVDIDGSGTATGEYAKFTANGIIGEEVADVKTDLSLNNVENTALSTWTGTTNIASVGTITAGTWTGTDIAIADGGTGQGTAQLAINALTAVSGGTNEYVLTKDTSTGNALWKEGGGGSDTPWSEDHSFADYYYDMEVQTKPADPSADHGRFYVKEIDSDNDGLFCLIRKNGAFEETQIV